MKLTSLIRKMVIAIVLFATTIFGVIAQTPFELVPYAGGLPDLGGVGGAAWGDINNDGYPDVVMTGMTSSEHGFTQVYLNNTMGGFDTIRLASNVSAFTPILPKLSTGTVSWVDYNRDGYLDLFINGQPTPSGTSGNDPIARLYKNNGDSTFSLETNATFDHGGTLGMCEWADFNNDGLPDLFLAGSNTRVTAGLVAGSGIYYVGLPARDNTFSYIYKNNGDGSFEKKVLNTGVFHGDVVVFDMDNDGWNDILLQGNSNAALAAYKNMGNMEFKGINNVQEGGSSKGWRISDYTNTGSFCMVAGDLNNDGFDDFVHLGGDQYPMQVLWNIYNKPENAAYPDSVRFGVTVAGGITYLTNTSLINFSHPYAISLGDYDNDGYLDILAQICYVAAGTGSANQDGRNRAVSYETAIWHNNGDKTFTKITMPSTFKGTCNGSVNFVDYNGDDKLDLFYFGASNPIYTNFATAGRTFLWKNVLPKSSKLPNTAADGLPASQMWSVVSGEDITFNWRRHSDPETSPTALTYNLRVGTSEGAGDRIMPSSDISRGSLDEGKVRNVALGSIKGSKSDTVSVSLKGFKRGKYYWNVQAVDGGFRGSKWAEKDAEVEITARQARNIRITEKTDTSFRVSWTKGSEAKSLVLLYTVTLPDYPAATAFPTLSNKKFYVASDDQSENERRPISLVEGLSQWACVYNNNDITNMAIGGNTDSSCIVRGLQPGSQYSVAVISFSGDLDQEKYIGSSSETQNPYITGTLPDYFNSISTAGLPALRNSEVAWGDYNNDGFTDLVISGVNANGDTITSLYKNTNGVFTELSGVKLPGLINGSLDWGDYNNDRNLDLLVTGYTSSKSVYGRTFITRLYKNNGDGTFTEKASGLPDVGNIDKNSNPIALGSNARFVDLNNDGLLDVAIAGLDVNKSRITRVYRNVGSPNYKYELMYSVDSKPMCNALFAFGDYNNDGFTDMIVGGDKLGASYNLLYKNLGNGTFAEDGGLSLESTTKGGALAFADVDHDGWLDLLSAGSGGFHVYRNVYGLFSTPIPIPELSGNNPYTLLNGGAVFADYNNDGWVDLLASGLYRTAAKEVPSMRVFKNNAGLADNVFTLQTSISMLPIKSGSISVADVDNNGIKDFYITGNVSTDNTEKDSCGLFFVGGVTAQLKPASPTNLTSSEINNYVVLSWDGFKKGMTYNIRFDSASIDKSYIPSDLVTGLSKTGSLRGALQLSSFKLAGLPLGSYHYSVQAIDTFGNSSLWSATATFVVTNSQAKDIRFSNYIISSAGKNIDNSVDVSWINGTQNQRVVFGYEGTNAAATLPSPTDGVLYGASSILGNGTPVGIGWYPIYQGSGSTVKVSNLDPTKVYTFVVYEISDPLIYNKVIAKGNPTYTFMPPLNNITSGITVNALDTARKIIRIKWNVPSGGGSKRIVFVNTDSSTMAIPFNDSTYLPKSAYNVGDKIYNDFEGGQEIKGIDTTGWRCVYNGSTTVSDSVMVQVRDIPASKTFSIKTVEYNGISGKELYNSTETINQNPTYFSGLNPYGNPTKSAYNINVTSAGSTQLSFKFTKGNGVKRAIFMNEDTTALVVGLPVLTDGVFYPANSAFKSVETKLGSTGWYCVYNGNATGTSAISVTNLKPGAFYRIFISEYNGNWDSGSEKYLVRDSTSKSNPYKYSTDFEYPLIQASSLQKTASTDSSFTLSWTRGDGSQCMVLALSGSSGDIKLNKDSTIIASNSFGNTSSAVGILGWYAVYKGSANVCTIKDIRGDGTAYRFKVIEMNGDAGKEKYLNTSGSNILNLTSDTVKVPTNQLSGLTFTSDTRRTDFVDISWTRGNGKSCIVFMKPGTTGSFVPVKNKTYTASTVLNGTDWQCVYNGKGNLVKVSGLSEGTSYVVVAMEYNGISSMEKYFAPGVSGIHVTHNTTLAPTIQVSNVDTVRLSMYGAALKWKRGSGDGAAYRVAIFAAKGLWNTSKYVPVQNRLYSGNRAFGVGDTITKDVYCIYNGLLDSTLLTNLVANTQYSVKGFAYNCKTDGSAPRYLLSDTVQDPLVFITKSKFTSNPSVQVDNLKTYSVDSTSFVVSWTKGDGNGRVVFIREGFGSASEVSIGSSGTNHTYFANTTFKLGEAYAGGTIWYCVYNGNGDEQVKVNGLKANTLYSIVAYEYNTDGAAIVSYRYSYVLKLNSNYANRYTSPTGQTRDLSFVTQTDKLQLSWGKSGNGTGRLVFFHEGNAKSVPLPVQLDTFYTANTVFGQGEQAGLSGWYCVFNASEGQKVLVSGLSSTKRYTAKVIEYNSKNYWVNYYTKDTVTNPIDTVTYSLVPTVLSNNIITRITYDSINAYPTKATIMWNKTLAQNYLLVVGPSDKVTVKNMNTYVADSVFNNGQSSITGTWFAIYNGADTISNVYGLQGETGYRAIVFPYNGAKSSGNEVYLKSGVEAADFTTDYMIPSIQASYVKFSDVDKVNGKALVSFKTGLRDKGYAKSVVFVTDKDRYGVPVLYHNRTYAASDSFGDGNASSINGWQCVYNGTNDSIELKGLDKNTEYRVAVCEYRGYAGFEKYNTLMDLDNPANITLSLVSGTESAVHVDGVKVYPNPVHDILNVAVETISKDSEFSLYSIDGTVLRSGKLEASITTINMASLSAGIYLIRIHTDAGVVVKQVVKQ